VTLILDSIQLFLCPNKQVVTDNGGAGQDGTGEFVGRYFFESIAAMKNGHDTLAAGQVQVVGGQQWRRRKIAADTFTFQRLTGLGVQAYENSLVRNRINASIPCYERRHCRCVASAPLDVARRHVAPDGSTATNSGLPKQVEKMTSPDS
jgi:hypothetical protein